MIHEIGVELGAALAGRKCPIKVIDGPEHNRKTTTGARERIVIEHDMQSGDTFGPKHVSDNRQPAKSITVFVAAKITIYAQCPSKNAIYWEHVRRAEKIRDMVVFALREVIVQRKNTYNFRGGKFVYPDDLKESETPGGAAYELYFTVDRGITDNNWDDTGAATTTIEAVYPGTSPTGIIIKNTDTATGPDGSSETIG